MAVKKKTTKASKEKPAEKTPTKKFGFAPALEKPEKAEKKTYSREEEEILKRKRRIEIEDDGDDLEIKVKKVKKKSAEDEEVWEDPRSYDKDEYFYEDASGDDKYM